MYACIGGQVGGVGGTREVYMMKEIKDMSLTIDREWLPIASMNDARYGACHAVIQSCVYIAGIYVIPSFLPCVPVTLNHAARAILYPYRW